MSMLEEIRDSMTDVWDSAQREADEFKDPWIVPKRLSDLYRGFGREDRELADHVLVDWAIAPDSTRRFDALLLIGQERILTAIPALSILRTRLNESPDAISRDEGELVQAVLVDLGAGP
jgi:hypothetical protein